MIKQQTTRIARGDAPNGPWVSEQPTRPTTSQQHVKLDLSLAQQARHTMNLANALGSSTPMFTSTKLLNVTLNYIQQEMGVLGIKNAQPGDPRRLQVYRDVFDYIIRHFKTYESILSDIKNEYEVTISEQRHTIEQLEPLKSKISLCRLETTKEIDKMRRAAMEEAYRLGLANRQLQREKELLISEADALGQEITKLADELRAKDNAAQSEELMRNRMKEMQAQSELLERQLADAIQQKEDEVREQQRITKKALADYTAACEELAKYKSSTSVYVARSEYEAMTQERDAALWNAAKLNDDLEKKKLELEDAIAKIAKKDTLLKKSEDNKYPNWEYVAMNCMAPVHEWGLMCKGLDCNDTIVVLVRQLILLKSQKSLPSNSSGGGSTANSRTDSSISEIKYFMGLGLGSDVPKYLRFKGKIPNRRLSKKDCCLLIEDTWSAKTLHDSTLKQKGSPRTTLAEFLYMYLKKRFGSQDVIVEWGYNIHEACKKHAAQSVDCKLFFDVLTDGVDEDVYHYVKSVIEHLKNAIHKHDSIIHDGKARGVIPKSAIPHILKDFWPYKDETSIQQLIAALDSDQSGETVSYQWLFQSGTESLFLDIVKEQELVMRDTYLTELTVVLRTISKDSKLSASDYAKGLMLYDTEKSRAVIDVYLARGFRLPLEAIKPRTLIEVDTFLKNLKYGILRKS
ncbi:Translin-associated factor X-interacting protein 1 [Chytridiales sp. JEL 0842]|nr:Translin-associated factor X-interacting protein 1 [Chytridiales sp. JEL 0842]